MLPGYARSWYMRITRVSMMALVASVALLAAACGDSGSTTTAAPTTAPPATTAAPTTAPPATTAAPTTAPPTTAAPTTTTAPTTTAATSPLPIGSTTGRWNNTTFGSTGAAVSDVTLNGGSLSVSLDLTDGSVLGAGIADLFSLDLPLDQLANGVTVETAALGTLKITIANGKVDVVGTNPPVPGIAGFTATGTITDTTLSGTYEVQFDSGDPATGTFEFPIA